MSHALTLRFANNAYLPLCAGLAGAIGALQVGQAHVPNPTEVPSEVTGCFDINSKLSISGIF